MSPDAQTHPSFDASAWSPPRGVIVTSLVAAAIGLATLVVGGIVDRTRAWFSYLQVWTFGTTVCVGALVLLMAGHAAKAAWMVVTRRITEAIVTAIPLYLVLFAPLAFGLSSIYPWDRPGDQLDGAVLLAVEHKRHYLNPPAFIARTLLYFAIFVAIGALLRSWSKANDRRPRLALVHRMRALSGAGLPCVGLALTWASFDWIMSLEPDWSSTIFGLYTFAGSFVGALALVCVMLHLARTRRLMPLRVTPDHAQAIGRVFFAMICFWAYQAFSQLLIYWMGDIPEEITYYQARTRGTWWAVTGLLVVGHFIVPFFALINRARKRRTGYLAAAGIWMLGMHFVDVYWLVMPVCDPSGVRPHWIDLGAILFFGGLSIAWIVRGYFGAAPLPLHDPQLAAGLHYEASL